MWVELRMARKLAHIEAYLKNRLPEHEFTVDELPRRDGAGSVSFKVGANASLEKELHDEAFWPKDVLVRRFRFLFRKPQSGQ